MVPDKRLLIADSHHTVQAQIKMRLSREPGIEIVGHAMNSIQAIQQSIALKPDIILIDPIMHDGLGLSAVKQIIASLPDTIVIILTAFLDTAMELELKKAGAHHILTKDIDTPRLVTLLLDPKIIHE